MQPEVLFPVSLSLRDKLCLVLGGGPIATAKMRPLLACGAQIRLVSTSVSAELAHLIANHKIEWIKAPLEQDHCRGVFLAIDSSECPDDSPLLRTQAKARNILINTVDKPETCDYFTPAVVRRGPVQVAISTGGAAPALARNIRQMLDRWLPRGLENLVARAAELRGHVQAQLDGQRQRDFWNRLFAPESMQRLARFNASDMAVSLKALMTDVTAGGPMKGKVTLVGAGAGAADMITLRGLKALESADVVLHDALIDPALLDHARRDAELIPVGKRCGTQSSTQDFINRTLANFARQGKNVVRLKCGDPFIFGRGGEEVLHLKYEGIEVEVIAGVTAAAVAAAQLALPLTHRGIARRITFMTASTSDALAADKPSWGALLAGGTIGLYMARRSLNESLEAIQAAGHQPSMPAVMVTNAGRPDTQVVHGTVGTLVQQLDSAEHDMSSSAPALVLIGDSMAATTRFETDRAYPLSARIT